MVLQCKWFKAVSDGVKTHEIRAWYVYIECNEQNIVYCNIHFCCFNPYPSVLARSQNWKNMGFGVPGRIHNIFIFRVWSVILNTPQNASSWSHQSLKADNIAKNNSSQPLKVKEPQTSVNGTLIFSLISKLVKKHSPMPFSWWKSAIPWPPERFCRVFHISSKEMARPRYGQLS